MKYVSFPSKSRSSFLWILAVTLICAACVPLAQPQPQLEITTPTGLQIVDPWARQAQMMGDDNTASMSNTLSTTASMTVTGVVTTTAMTTTAAPSTTNAMSDTLGMGIGGAMGAMYMTIRNPTNTPDRLIKAQSDVSKVVELHNMAIKDGMMTMFPVEAIDVPANGEAVLEPGSFHVMLIGLNRDLTSGDSVTITLTFEQAGDVTLQAPIRER